MNTGGARRKENDLGLASVAGLATDGLLGEGVLGVIWPMVGRTLLTASDDGDFLGT